MFCKGTTVAKKLYERDVLRIMAAYMVLLFCSSWFVKHDGGQKFLLYFWSVIPAIPIIVLIARMGRYLQTETDEYQRLMAMYSVLVGTAALLATLVVNDFVRAFANAPALPPFISFIIFFFGMGITQAVQKLRDRVPADD